jgi:hypothetical protein
VGTPWRPRGPDDLDEDQRARIRYQVMSGLRARKTSLADRVYDAAGILALPAPHIVRALVSAALVVAVVASATVASAESLPEEALYGVKLASEQIRLALAATPVDRAAVELSMAEHRLVEAERLASGGREIDALVATSTYGEHLANAAAALATVERVDPVALPVVDQLKQRLAEQQRRASEVAAYLAADPRSSNSAPVFLTVASNAPALPSGASVAEGIAEHAANVADRIAVVAEQIAVAAEIAETPAAASDDEDEDDADPDAAPEPAALVPAPGPRTAPDRPADPPRASAPPAPLAEAARQTVAVGQTGPRATDPSRVRVPSTAAAAAQRSEARQTPAAKPSPKVTARPTLDPKKVAEAAKARLAADKAKAEAEKARLAAVRAKEAAKKTATPRPTPNR